MSFADRFRAAFRSFQVDGVPASGPYEPEKALIRSLGSALDIALAPLSDGALIGGASVVKATKTALDADLAHPAGTMAVVWQDGADNGIYVKAGASGSGSWSLTDLTLPASFASDLAAVQDEVETLAPQAAVVRLDDGGKTGGIQAAAQFAGSAGVGIKSDGLTYLFPITGQSNVGAYASAGAAIATSPIYPGRALMPETGVKLFDEALETTTPRRLFGRMANLVETLTANTSETIASGFVNHLIKGLDDAVPGNGARIATFVANRGASSLAQISPGSATFRALIAGVQMTAEAEAAAGRRVVVPGVLFMQGESNLDASGFEYADQLERYRRTLEAEVQRVTGQADSVVLFVGQTNAVAGYLPLDRQAIQLCQVDAAQRYPFIRLAGPVYALPMESSSDAPSSLVHKSPIGANRMGQMFARAVQAEIFGRGWSTFAPYDARFVSTTVLELRYRVPVRPLVIDTTGDVAISGMATTRGFDVLEANAPAPNQTSTPPTFASTRIGIASVATFKTNPNLGEDAVRITLSAAPVSPWVHVAYALRRDDPNSTQDGPVSGARGCIRDSAAQASLYDAHANHNWAAAWCQPVRSFQ